MKNKILTNEEWKEKIKKIEPSDLLNNKEKIKEKLKLELINSIKKCFPDKKFGILFSGGVDSSTIALISKQLKKDFVCYTVGIGDSEDVRYAKEVAEKFGFKLKVKILTLEEIEEKIKILSRILPIIDVVKIGVGLVTYSGLEMAKEDKIDTIFSGLGSEELFAGYQRHLESNDINKECLNGLLEMNSRDNIRDLTIGNYLGIKVEAPFLDEDLIKLALEIPGKFKIDKENKLILREVSYDLGLGYYAFRKKRAAQYGSNFDKAIEKIAKKNGFNYKSEYIDSLKKMNLGILFSGGKDSCLAMYKNRNNNLKCLISVISDNPDSYMFHPSNEKILNLQAEALNIPLLVRKTKGIKEKELKDLENAIKEAKEKYDLNGIVTGALFSEYQASRIKKICDNLNLKCVNPLWHMDQEEELRELIKSNFEVIIVSIAADGLDEKWIERKLDNEMINDLKKLNEKIGLNLAFEGGEAESLVLNCPLFKKKIKIIDSKIIMESKNVGKLIINKAILE